MRAWFLLFLVLFGFAGCKICHTLRGHWQATFQDGSIIHLRIDGDFFQIDKGGINILSSKFIEKEKHIILHQALETKEAGMGKLDPNQLSVTDSFGFTMPTCNTLVLVKGEDSTQFQLISRKVNLDLDLFSKRLKEKVNQEWQTENDTIAVPLGKAKQDIQEP